MPTQSRGHGTRLAFSARFRSRLGQAGRGALFLLVAGSLPLLRAAEAPDSPVHFVPKYVLPERVPDELARVRQGILVRLPRAEFEARVKQAMAPSAPLDRPHLVKARYRAELDTQSRALVGSGDWTVINPAARGGVLPLPGLRLPVQKVQVGTNRAVLFSQGGSAAALWLDQAGQQTVTFDWSVRGTSGVGELHFDLQVPACAAATLELRAPADYLVTIPRNAAVLTGPHAAPRPDQRVWHLSFAGQSQVSLMLRRQAGPGVLSGLILAGMQSNQQLLPNRLVAEYRECRSRIGTCCRRPRRRSQRQARSRRPGRRWLSASVSQSRVRFPRCASFVRRPCQLEGPGSARRCGCGVPSIVARHCRFASTRIWTSRPGTAAAFACSAPRRMRTVVRY